MDEITPMLFFLSQEYLVYELQMEACNGGEGEEGLHKEVNHSLNHLQITDELSTTILHTN